MLCNCKCCLDRGSRIGRRFEFRPATEDSKFDHDHERFMHACIYMHSCACGPRSRLRSNRALPIRTVVSKDSGASSCGCDWNSGLMCSGERWSGCGRRAGTRACVWVPGGGACLVGGACLPCSSSWRVCRSASRRATAGRFWGRQCSGDTRRGVGVAYRRHTTCRLSRPRVATCSSSAAPMPTMGAAPC